MKIVWTVPAQQDLMNVFDFVAHGNAAAAETIERIIEAVENLKPFPSLSRPGHLPNTRELIIADTPYFIPYRIKGNEIQILSVIHGARKWPD